jgi:hypothetical protein
VMRVRHECRSTDASNDACRVSVSVSVRVKVCVGVRVL